MQPNKNKLKNAYRSFYFIFDFILRAFHCVRAIFRNFPFIRNSKNLLDSITLKIFKKQL
jgi:hypothetical protein